MTPEDRKANRHQKKEDQNLYTDIQTIVKSHIKQKSAMVCSTQKTQTLLVGVIVAIIAVVLALAINDYMQQTSIAHDKKGKETATPQNCEPRLSHLRTELNQSLEELKLTKKRLQKEKKNHKQLQASCERLQSSYKLMEKIEQLYDERVKDKDEHLGTKDKAIESLETSIGSLKSELRIVKDQMANIKTQLISLEDEQRTADTECKTTLCSGLKLLKTSVDAILGVVA